MRGVWTLPLFSPRSNLTFSLKPQSNFLIPITSQTKSVDVFDIYDWWAPCGVNRGNEPTLPPSHNTGRVTTWERVGWNQGGRDRLLYFARLGFPECIIGRRRPTAKVLLKVDISWP